jgi:polyhydroxyalkanoate synthesis regulator phasin
MAQARRSGQRKSGGRSSAASKSRSTSAASRSAAAKKGAQTRKRRQAARKGARATARTATRPAEAAGVSTKTVAEFREALRKNLIRPLDMVMLTRDRIEEVLGEAVERGRMTTDDAQKVASRLLDRGRKQTRDVLDDLEQLIGRGRDEIEGRTAGARKAGTDAARRARRDVETAARGARTRATRAADPAIVQADRVRRVAGVGPSFPVLGYDELTAAQVQGRLGGLSPAELRKVRDYERRHANRKSVLNAIEKKLA